MYITQFSRLQPLVHTHNLPISWSDVVDIFQVVDEEGDDGNTAEASEPADEASYKPNHHSILVFKDCLHLRREEGEEGRGERNRKVGGMERERKKKSGEGGEGESVEQLCNF